MEIKNKVAIVTGISKGIGKETTLQLLEKGAIVAGFGKNKPEYSHPNLHFIATDVRNLDSVTESIDKFNKEIGNEVHILVNNAGLGYFGYFEEMPVAEFTEMIEVNVYGIFNMCRFVIPKMKSQKYGHIVNISSIAGFEGMAQSAGYCASKHAVRGISDSLFRELREFGIKVTGIYPGSTKTDFFKNSHGIKAHDYMMSPKEVAGEITRCIETSDNFLVNEIVLRPLNPKPPKQ